MVKINPKTGNKQYKSVYEMIWDIDSSLYFKIVVTFKLLKNDFLRLFKKDKDNG